MHTVTIEDAALYDTDFVDRSARNVLFFVNTRIFLGTEGPGYKTWRTHTNLPGSGGGLPAGYTFVARSVLVESNRDGASLKQFVGDDRFFLWVDNRGPFFWRDHERGHPSHHLEKPVTIEHGQALKVVWPDVRPRVVMPFTVRVSLLGALTVPALDGDEQEIARLKAIYGRGSAPKIMDPPESMTRTSATLPVGPIEVKVAEFPVCWLWVHHDCINPSEKIHHGPMTRHNWNKLPQNTRTDPRKAWWCSRCGEKIRQTDMVAAVEVKS